MMTSERSFCALWIAHAPKIEPVSAAKTAAPMAAKPIQTNIGTAITASAIANPNLKNDLSVSIIIPFLI
jgi:hypothetical protein